MYERLLISLDGSELAEAILAFAEQIAGPLHAPTSSPEEATNR